MPNTSTPDWSAAGKKRLAVCDQAKSPEDWKRLWIDAPFAFPFEYGACWSFSAEFMVADFEAEIGFFIDGLCLESYVLQRDFAMFTDPSKSFYFSISPAQDAEAVSPAAFRLGFMVKRLEETVADLERRGIVPIQPVFNPYPGSPMLKAVFATPNGIQIDLWSVTEQD
jgi:hypothetical protein